MSRICRQVHGTAGSRDVARRQRRRPRAPEPRQRPRSRRVEEILRRCPGDTRLHREAPFRGAKPLVRIRSNPGPSAAFAAAAHSAADAAKMARRFMEAPPFGQVRCESASRIRGFASLNRFQYAQNRFQDLRRARTAPPRFPRAVPKCRRPDPSSGRSSGTTPPGFLSSVAASCTIESAGQSMVGCLGSPISLTRTVRATMDGLLHPVGLTPGLCACRLFPFP